jgi:hypothetical protein
MAVRVGNGRIERELKRVLGAGRENAAESLKGLALRREGQEIVRRLAKKSRGATDVEENQEIRETIQYVTANLDWIENSPRLDEYESGPVDKTFDIAISKRFKNQGKIWLREGANPLMKIRLLKLNSEWEIFWDERREGVARYAAFSLPAGKKYLLLLLKILILLY